MNPKLLANKELDNYTVNDSFNFLTKAEAIKIFLEQNSVGLEQNKMLVLYGDWGSGKTSLMKHIEKEIDKKIYKPIFFHAWEHEKDENLALSLCDALIDCLDDTAADLIKPFMKGALLTLKGFTNAITFKSSHLLKNLGLELEFSGEKFNAVLDKAFEDEKPRSFYANNKEFKDSFLAIENKILKQYDAQKLLIFVDDLDRCEPENVLNLITALKLFFTYGKKSVFLCGIDKDAITKAVKTKYKDIVKSEEYMEKVFDIAFNMPKTFSLFKILNPHFLGKTKFKNSKWHENVEVIEDFFRSLKFTNPRHLKKVLNKYEILKSFKTFLTIPDTIKDLIPNIILDDQSGNVFETIYCLFMIILYEFHESDFVDAQDYHQKMVRYIDILSKSVRQDKDAASTIISKHFEIKNIKGASLKEILDDNGQPQGLPVGFSKFLYVFSHSAPSSLESMLDHQLNKYNQNFDDNQISTNFCKFLIKHAEEIKYQTQNSDYKIWSLFEMVKYLL